MGFKWANPGPPAGEFCGHVFDQIFRRGNRFVLSVTIGATRLPFARFLPFLRFNHGCYGSPLRGDTDKKGKDFPQMTQMTQILEIA